MSATSASAPMTATTAAGTPPHWPPTLSEALTLLRACEPALRAEGVIRAGVFGSVARGEATSQSDVDVVVAFGWRGTLLQLGAVHYRLEQAFGRPVDVLTDANLSAVGGRQALADVHYAFG